MSVAASSTLNADFLLHPPQWKGSVICLVEVNAGKEGITVLIRRLKYPKDNLIMHLMLNHLCCSQFKL